MRWAERNSSICSSETKLNVADCSKLTETTHNCCSNHQKTINKDTKMRIACHTWRKMKYNVYKERKKSLKKRQVLIELWSILPLNILTQFYVRLVYMEFCLAYDNSWQRLSFRNCFYLWSLSHYIGQSRF